jgi:spore coat polysaccharide biosynthesis protein SpsF
MKVVAIIQARMGSTRLPNKVLMPVMGKPLLGWMLDRLSVCTTLDNIIVATTTHASDDVIEEYVYKYGHKVYRGSQEDVLDRYYQAALIGRADVIVRITADCPLLDPAVVDEMVALFANLDLDYLSNSEPLPATWPDGMDVSIMRFDALLKAWKEAQKPSDREHVTFFFWNNLSLFKCKRHDHNPDLSNYRLTIDYQEDFDLLKKIIEHFGGEGNDRIKNLTMKEIINFLLQNPEIYRLNEMYKRGAGWEPSFDRDRIHGYK